MAGCQLPVLLLSGSYTLRVDVTPLVYGEDRPTQDLNVVLDGVLVGHFTLNQPTSLIIPLPRELTEGREILVEVHRTEFMQAMRSRDVHRQAAARFRVQTGGG